MQNQVCQVQGVYGSFFSGWPDFCDIHVFSLFGRFNCSVLWFLLYVSPSLDFPVQSSLSTFLLRGFGVLVVNVFKKIISYHL